MTLHTLRYIRSLTRLDFAFQTIISITLPTLRYLYTRREWFQSLESSSVSDSSSSSTSASSINGVDVSSIISESSSSSSSSAVAHKIRDAAMRALENKHVDVLVVGGGATGLYSALDAASRGLSVALVEQSDFGSGSTGASTGLLHCGFKRAQMAIRQRDVRQLLQMLYDVEELRVLERTACGSCSASSSSSSSLLSGADNDNDNNKNNKNDTTCTPCTPTTATTISPMPCIIPVSSWTELSEFTASALAFATCSLLAGLPQWARPMLYTTVDRKHYQNITERERDNMLPLSYVVPERRLDGYSLSRRIAKTAQRHGATVLNYARLIGFDCEESAPRDEHETFSVVSSWDLSRRGMDTDGQPYPWFDTARGTDYFSEAKTAKPKESDLTSDNDDEQYGGRAAVPQPRYSAADAGKHQSNNSSSSLSATAAADGSREEERPYYKVHAAVIRDELSGKMVRVYPKYVLNCAGRGSDSVRRMFPVSMPTVYERFSTQFFVKARHLSSSSFSSSSSSSSENEQQQKNTEEDTTQNRFGLVSARNHVDAKPLFVFPDRTLPKWSLIGPVDSPIDSADPYYSTPEKIVVTAADPSSTSPSVFRELREPRITLTDLAFIATGADIFGVSVDSGFVMSTPRVLCDSWPGSHAPLGRALRFGGAVDYRTMHQKVVHSVGSDIIWSRKKAEWMVDSFFIEQSRQSPTSSPSSQDQKNIIPKCKTRRIALASDDTTNHGNSDKSTLETQLRLWARLDGCSTVLDAMLRRMPSSDVLPVSASERDAIVDRTAKILAEEWGWSKARLRSEVQSAKSYFHRTCFSGEARS